MADILGTNVAGAIVPFNTLDRYATHFALYGKGGFRSVPSIMERNAIPTERREVGMWVRVTNVGPDNGTYELQADLTTWKPLNQAIDASIDGLKLLLEQYNTILDGVLTNITTLTARTDSAFSQINDVRTVQAGFAQSVSTLTTEVNNVKSSVTSIRTAQENLATSLNSVKVETANVRSLAQQSMTATDQLAQIVTDLQFNSGNNSSTIQEIQRVTASLAEQVTTVNSKADGNTAKVTQLISAENGRLSKYVLTLDSNGVVVGMTAMNGGDTTSNNITFTTDNFRIVGTGAGASPIFETINGVTYIKRAIIGSGRVGSDELGGNSSTRLTGARDVNEYQSNGSIGVTVQIFGFTMDRPGEVQIAYTSQIDQAYEGGFLAQWRVQMDLDGVYMAAAEGVTKSPCAINAYQILGAGYHELVVSFLGHPNTKIKGQSISTLGRWR